MKRMKVLMAVALTCLLSLVFGQNALAAYSEEELNDLQYQAQVILFYVTDESFLLTVGLPAEELQAISQTSVETMDAATLDSFKKIAVSRLDSSREEIASNIESIFSSYMGISLNGNLIIDAVKGYNAVADSVGILNMLAEAKDGDYFEIKDRAVNQDNAGGATISYVVAATKSDVLVTAVFDSNAAMTSLNITQGSRLGAGMGNGLSDGAMKLIVLVIILAILGLLAFVSNSKKKAFEVHSDSLESVNTANTTNAVVALGADVQLVAVIAAAIAASQGRECTDGIVIRSIRRR